VLFKSDDERLSLRSHVSSSVSALRQRFDRVRQRYHAFRALGAQSTRRFEHAPGGAESDLGQLGIGRRDVAATPGSERSQVAEGISE
jgi:hypothetical protein